MRAIAPALLVALSALAGPGAASADAQIQDAGWLEILEPEEWRGPTTRGLTVRARRSLRVVGLAGHPRGIRRVLVNGYRASVAEHPDGGVRFVGYVPVRADLRQVDVVAYAGDGRPLTRRFELTPLPAEQAYPDPDEAWREAGGGFRGERWAVVVGLSDYRDPGIQPLRYADDDARAFYRFLVSDQAGLGGFEPDNVRLLVDEDATFQNLRTALFSFLRRATERDVVYVFFAGHGAPDPARPDDFYLLTYDTDAKNLAGTAFPMEDVRDALRGVQARDIVVLTDACHSAAVGGGVAFRDGGTNAINRVFLDRLEASTGGFVTFTASEVNQLSQEDARWGGGHGVFTHYLLRALGGEADGDGDRIVTLGEAVEHVRDRVQRETENAQVPSVSQTAFDRSWPMSIVLPGRELAAVVERAPPAEVTRRSLPEPSSFGPNAPAPAEPGGGTPEGAEAAEESEGAETEAAPREASAAGALSPESVLAQGLLVPGLGEFRLQRPVRGALVAGGAAAAGAWGLLSERVIEECRVDPQGGRCPPDQLVGTRSERPNLVAGLAVAGAVTLLGAIDAYRAAKGEGGAAGSGARARSRASLVLLPGVARTAADGSAAVTLVRLRFRGW